MFRIDCNIVKILNRAEKQISYVEKDWKPYDTGIMLRRAFSSSDGDAAGTASTGDDAEENGKEERVRRKRDNVP